MIKSEGKYEVQITTSFTGTIYVSRLLGVELKDLISQMGQQGTVTHTNKRQTTLINTAQIVSITYEEL